MYKKKDQIPGKKKANAALYVTLCLFLWDFMCVKAKFSFYTYN